MFAYFFVGPPWWSQCRWGFLEQESLTKLKHIDPASLTKFEQINPHVGIKIFSSGKLLLKLPFALSLSLLSRFRWVYPPRPSETMWCYIMYMASRILFNIISLRCCWPEVTIPSSQVIQGDRNGGSAPLFRQRITIDFIVSKAVHSTGQHRSRQLWVMQQVLVSPGTKPFREPMLTFIVAFTIEWHNWHYLISYKIASGINQ